AEDRKHFETYFVLDPHRAEKLKFGRVLNSFLLQAGQKKEHQENPAGYESVSRKFSKWSKIAIFCCLAVILGFGIFVLFRIQSLKTQVESIRRSEEQLRIRIGKLEKSLNGDEENRGSTSQSLLRDSSGLKIMPVSKNEFEIVEMGDTQSMVNAAT